MSEMSQMAVAVFGSINMDLVAQVPRLPQPGETLTGDRFSMIPGGKGANQAVTIARLGVTTQMVGRVGADGFGQALVEGLMANGVRCDRLFVDASTHSGMAMIAVDRQAENQIIVVPGANGRVGEPDVERLIPLLAEGQWLLLQLEIPVAAVVAAARAARQAGGRVMLDPAPARSDLPDALFPLVDILTPNQVEATQLVGFPVTDVETAIQAAIALRQKGVGRVIVKLGQLGAVCVSADETLVVPAFAVTAVDTVAAGDAFNGGLAAALATGQPFSTALRWAAATAALSVTQPGAQSSLPTRAALDAFLHSSQADAGRTDLQGRTIV